VVYGRRKAFRRTVCAAGRETKDLRGNDENERPGDEDEKIGNAAEKVIAVVAHLQRFDPAAEASRNATSRGGRFLNGEGQNFKCQQHEQDCRNSTSPFHRDSLFIFPTATVKNCPIFHESSNPAGAISRWTVDARKGERTSFGQSHS